MSLSIYLNPEQVVDRLAKMRIPCHFSAEEKADPITTPIVDEGVRVFGFVIPQQNERLNLSFIRECVGTDPASQPSIFDHPWYANEAFMTVPCAPGWHFLHMDVLSDSVGQPSDYARSLMAKHLRLPSAVELVLMLCLHYVETGEQLLHRKHSWCADRASRDRQVTVGAFGRNGIFLSGHPQNFASRGLGICPRLQD